MSIQSVGEHPQMEPEWVHQRQFEIRRLRVDKIQVSTHPGEDPVEIAKEINEWEYVDEWYEEEAE